MQNMGINKLADMFMGNPQPLAQKVQQAQQQAKPGQIPPDLKEALALQQIQEMRQSVDNQQAMQQGGPQPTVVEQIKQMLKQQAAQQVAQQSALQGMPQSLPQGVPPVQAAHGGHIAQLMSNLGRNYGSGGIVAFAGGGRTIKQRQDIEDKLEDMRREEDFNSTNFMDNYYGNKKLYPGDFEKEYVEEGKTKTVFHPTGMPENVRPEDAKVVAKMPPPSPQVMPEGLGAYFQSTKAPAAPPPPSEVENYLRNKLAVDEAAKGKSAQQAYDEAVGTVDTSGIDRSVEELKRRQSKFEAPATGMPALMEYLQQIALTPKGVGSLTAGAMGAQKVNELQQNREAQQFDLAKQILEQEQKKADVKRAYAKELYGVNTAAAKEAGKEAYDAAIALHKSEDEARKLQKEAEIRYAEMASREKTSAASNAATIAAANAPGKPQQVANQIMALEKQNTPASLAEAKRLEALYSVFSGSGNAGVGAAKNLVTATKISLAGYQAVLAAGSGASAEEKATAREKIPQLLARLETLGGMVKEEEGGTSEKPPKTVSFDQLPK